MVDNSKTPELLPEEIRGKMTKHIPQRDLFTEEMESLVELLEFYLRLEFYM